MTIEPAALADAATILALQKIAYQSEAVLYHDNSLPPLRQTLPEIEAEFATQIFLKATHEERLVGAVRAFFQNDTAHIGRLIVTPDMQGRGIGKALMHAIEQAFPQAQRFELFTGSRSERNIALYQKLGYSIFKTQVLNPQVTLVYLEKERG